MGSFFCYDVKMKAYQIKKLYASNFLTGMVFWYGIEKLFMESIGIDAVGIGIVTAAIIVFITLFDIPIGILADKWSRKGTLVISALALAVASFVASQSDGLWMYLIASLFYGLSVIASNGTYQAIIYDSLHEDGRSSAYSRINGRIYAFFLVGVSIANVLSGFISHELGFRNVFLLTVIPSLLNVGVMLSLHEPRFHKSINKEKILRQIGKASVQIARIKPVRILAIVMILFTAVELFKLNFGQLYMFHYIASPQAIGLLWATFAIAMAVGNIIAHRFKNHLRLLILGSTLPLLLMALVDNSLSIALFMVQAVAASALLNQIETRVQDNTPSAVRASVISVISTLGRAISIPTSFVLGWLFKNYGALAAVRFTAMVAIIILVFWLAAQPRLAKPAIPTVRK